MTRSCHPAAILLNPPKAAKAAKAAKAGSEARQDRQDDLMTTNARIDWLVWFRIGTFPSRTRSADPSGCSTTTSGRMITTAATNRWRTRRTVTSLSWTTWSRWPSDGTVRYPWPSTRPERNPPLSSGHVSNMSIKIECCCFLSWGSIRTGITSWPSGASPICASAPPRTSAGRSPSTWSWTSATSRPICANCTRPRAKCRRLRRLHRPIQRRPPQRRLPTNASSG